MRRWRPGRILAAGSIDPKPPRGILAGRTLFGHDQVEKSLVCSAARLRRLNHVGELPSLLPHEGRAGNLLLIRGGLWQQSGPGSQNLHEGPGRLLVDEIAKELRALVESDKA